MTDFKLENNNVDEAEVVDTPDANEHLPEVTADDVTSKEGGEFQTGINEDSNAEEWGDFVQELMEPEQIELENAFQETKGVPSDEPKVEPKAEEAQPESPAIKPEVDPDAAEPVKAEAEAVGDTGGLVIPEQPAKEEVETKPLTDEQFQALQKDYMQKLTSMYAMSEEDAVRFAENPAEVLPQLAANLHAKVLQNVMTQMREQMPQAISRETQTRTITQRNETEFMETWPELKDHTPVVAQVAQEWRRANPTASREQAIKAVGFNTLVKLGVDPSQAAARLAKGYVPPQASPAPAAMKPHTPVGAGRTSVRHEATPPSPSLWEEMVSFQEEWQG